MFYLADFALLRKESKRFMLMQKRPQFDGAIEHIKEIAVPFIGFPHEFKSLSVTFSVICQGTGLRQRLAFERNEENVGDLYRLTPEAFATAFNYYKNMAAIVYRNTQGHSQPLSTELICRESITVEGIDAPVYYIFGTNHLRNMGISSNSLDYIPNFSINAKVTVT